jgi:hypothetical protein
MHLVSRSLLRVALFFSVLFFSPPSGVFIPSLLLSIPALLSISHILPTLSLFGGQLTQHLCFLYFSIQCQLKLLQVHTNNDIVYRILLVLNLLTNNGM